MKWSRSRQLLALAAECDQTRQTRLATCIILICTWLALRATASTVSVCASACLKLPLVAAHKWTQVKWKCTRNIFYIYTIYTKYIYTIYVPYTVLQFSSQVEYSSKCYLPVCTVASSFVCACCAWRIRNVCRIFTCPPGSSSASSASNNNSLDRCSWQHTVCAADAAPPPLLSTPLVSLPSLATASWAYQGYQWIYLARSLTQQAPQTAKSSLSATLWGPFLLPLFPHPSSPLCLLCSCLSHTKGMCKLLLHLFFAANCCCSSCHNLQMLFMRLTSFLLQCKQRGKKKRER